MKNTDIKYNTSRDYVELYQILKSGLMVIGFVALDFQGKPHAEYSKLVDMRYHADRKCFDIGFTIFEQDFDRLSFENICERYNIQYLTPNPE